MVVVRLRRLATSAATALRSDIADIAIMSVARSILRGRPPMRPRARAAASPAMVRSAISSRSNSANAAKMPNARRPLAVVVSICAPAPVSTFKPDAPGAQVLDRVDQVTQVAPEPVELPEHQRVAGLDRLQAGSQPGAGIVTAGRQVFVDTGGINAGRQHRVPLRRQRLGAVRLGDADVADQHRSTGTPQER